MGSALLTEWIANRLPQQQTYTQWRQAQFGSTVSPDGQTNAAEYASGTNPNSGSSFPILAASLNGTTATLTFTVPGNHTWIVEHTTDLQNWTRWPAPTNDHRPAPGGPITVTGPAASGSAYYRVRITAD